MHTNSVFQGHTLYIAPSSTQTVALLPNAEVNEPYDEQQKKENPQYRSIPRKSCENEES